MVICLAKTMLPPNPQPLSTPDTEAARLNGLIDAPGVPLPQPGVLTPYQQRVVGLSAASAAAGAAATQPFQIAAEQRQISNTGAQTTASAQAQINVQRADDRKNLNGLFRNLDTFGQAAAKVDPTVGVLGEIPILDNFAKRTDPNYKNFNAIKTDLNDQLTALVAKGIVRGKDRNDIMNQLLNVVPGVTPPDQIVKQIAFVKNFIANNNGYDLATDFPAHAKDAAVLDGGSNSNPSVPTQGAGGLPTTPPATPGQTPNQPSVSDRLNSGLQGMATMSGLNPQAIANNPLMKFLFGPTMNFAQDVTSGAMMNGKFGQNILDSQQQAMDAANKAMKAAQTAKNPAEKLKLIAVAHDAYDSVAQGSHGIASMFSPDVNKSAAHRGFDVGSNVPSIVDSAELLGKVPGAIGTALHPFEAVGTLRDAAIKAAESSGKTVSGDGIIASLEKAGQTLSPADKPAFDGMLESARTMYKGKGIPIGDAVNITTQANKAFTAAGTVGKSSRAAFNKVLGDSLRDQIANVAPEVTKYTKYFENLYKAQKLVRQLKLPFALTAGSTIGGMILGRETGAATAP
jgi:hypothetical protein